MGVCTGCIKWLEVLVTVGEMPENCPGDCQLETVEGDWPGELSSLIEWGVEVCTMVDAVFGIISIPSGSFFRWPRCFSSIFKRPSFVKGFGKTSFIPSKVMSASREEK